MPNVLNSLGLLGKVSYGYIKGKNNYICKSKFYEYKKKYTKENINQEDIKKEDIMALIILENLIKDGEYGDIEEISYTLLKRFKTLKNHIKNVTCDVDLCKPKKCNENCLYKKRVDELKEEDITVINHSLLAKWPYKDEKPLENIIVDEAHNLIEKGYDFFSEEIQYKKFNYFLREIFPSELSVHSKYYKNSNDKGNVNQKRKIKLMDIFYQKISLDKDIKSKISYNINFIFEKMQEILDFGINEGYPLITKFDLNWEINLQQDEKIGTLYKKGEYVNITYKSYCEFIKQNLENVLSNINKLLVIFKNNIDENLIDKESEIYKYGKSKIKYLKDIANILEKFLEDEKGELIAKIVSVSNKFDNFLIKVVPLNLADLFRENILSNLNCAVFVSATLSVDDKMDYFINTLGINEVRNTQKIIKPIYNYKERVNVIRQTDLGGYKSEEFISNISQSIKSYSKISNSNVLSLFTSKKRLEQTYEILKESLVDDNINVYMNKEGIKILKKIENKNIVLGSKGCFEGVDIPGDGLTFVTLDKLPNLQPKDPLYFSIITKLKKSYFEVNYPQMIIKVKQALGRLLRSKYDYGIFIIFNMGNNTYIDKKLEQNLNGCKIKNLNKKNITDNISNHLKINRKKVIINLITDILKNKEYTKNNIDLVKYINNQIKNNSINAKVKYYDKSKDKIVVKYYDLKYLVEIKKVLKS